MALADNGARTLVDGRQVVTTNGTRVQLATTDTPCVRIHITAISTNTNVVTVGGSTVVGAAATRRGIGLGAGTTITLNVTNLAALWLDSVTNGEGVSYAYEVQ